MKFCDEAMLDKLKYGTVTTADVDALLFSVQQATIEHMLQILPGVIEKLITHTSYIKKLSEDFYDKNKDLANNKETVRHVLERIEADNPGIEYEKLLEKVAPAARNRLAELGKMDNRNVEAPELGKLDSDLGEL